jgi:hypothetical protein
MADYFAEGTKTIKCHSGKDIIVPLNTTAYQCTKNCPDCQNHFILLSYYGAIVDKNGNYVY